MTQRPKPAKTSPLLPSSVAVRGIATVLTLSSFGGMTAFAATHVQNAAAPLRPTAPATTVAQPTPTPVATSRTPARRTTVTSGVTTTTTTARTRTRKS